VAPPRGQCAFCPRPVLQNERAAFPVSGWEVEREQGGANRILGRTREPNVIAHAACAERHFKMGDQMGLEGMGDDG
jgi:hypothetical protein